MKKKYELTTDIIQHNGITLYRIRALIDIPKYGIKASDLGGYIQFEDNLSHDGDCWIGDNAWVYGKAHVSDNAIVYDNAKVYGKAQVYANAHVFDKARVFDNSRVYGDALVSDNARVYGNAWVYGDAWVFGKAMVFGDSKLSGYINIGLSTQVKDVELNGIHSFDDFVKLYPLKIRNNKAILYKAVHKIDDKCLSDYDNNFEYKIGQIYEHNCDSDIREDCSFGLHVAIREWAINYCEGWKDLAILEVEVPINKIIVPLSSSGKLRTSELRVIREIPIEEYK